MFWGLIMEPNKRYTQVVEKPFHISQAAMDISTGDLDPCQVMVVVENKNFLVCTLQKSKCIQVPLDLYFKSGDSVAFLTNGKCNVHLTGYLDPEFEEDPSDDEEEEDEEEEEDVPALVPAKSKRKLENSNDVSATKKAKKEKTSAPADSSDEDDDEDQLQKLLEGEDIDTDENDDSFKVNTSAEADSDDDSEEDEDNDDEEGDEVAEDAEEEKHSEEEAETTIDTSKEESVDMSKLSKSQKRKLKKKLKQQQQQESKASMVNGVDKAKKQQDGQKDKKKQDGKKDDGAGDKKENKVVSGGVQIEDLKVGNGPVAKPGKTVAVYYEGRLKQNNKMFDSCTKGAGFKFRLGAKEVISGWDVGIAGMKVGGKRRVVCPPAMAYGAKGSPPVIPSNSTLVFEVELKNVK